MIGHYYSDFETASIIESFRRSCGSSFAQEPSLNFEDFVRLMCCLNDFTATSDPAKSAFSGRPSQCVDFLARGLYPVLYGLKVAVCFAIIDNY